MSAQIIPLKNAQSVKTSARLGTPSKPPFQATPTSIASCCWQRARLTVEVVGWTVVAVSAVAAFWF